MATNNQKARILYTTYIFSIQEIIAHEYPPYVSYGKYASEYVNNDTNNWAKLFNKRFNKGTFYKNKKKVYNR